MGQGIDVVNCALVEARTEVAGMFSQLVINCDSQALASFLVNYCGQAATITGWMSEWLKQIVAIYQATLPAEQQNALQNAVTRLTQRQVLLQQDQQSLCEWFKQMRQQDASITPGMKRLRHVFQACIRHRHVLAGLFALAEIERARFVHSMTLLKLCELKLGRGVFRCLSHVRFQRQQIDSLAAVLESSCTALIASQSSDSMQIISTVKETLAAYADYIEQCYAASVKQVAAV
jgi:hypothetical protein